MTARADTEREPLRVLEISVRSDLGGGPKHLADLLRAWKDAPYAIQAVVAAPSEGEHAAEFVLNSFAAIPIPHRRFSPRVIAYLREACYRHGIRVIHSHGKGAGLYSRLLSWLTGIPVLHTFHGLHEPVTPKEKIYRVIERVLSRRTRTYVCVSEAEKNVAFRSYGIAPAKCRVIRNGVDSEKLRSGNPRYRPSSGGKTFGILSRMEEFPKNVGLAIRSFAEAGGDLELIVAGDGPDLERYRALARALGVEGRVRFLGMIREVEDFFASIDVYVSLSSKEGLPYALLEARAAGKACLLSDIPPHREAAPAATEWFDGSAASWRRAATLGGSPENSFTIDEMATATLAALEETAGS